ncbi:MAG: alpha/beta fold hydrolase [Bacteroidetes bacterium]|nr:alpha/beta fold hydrolase [Bacteroidota bacterium]
MTLLINSTTSYILVILVFNFLNSGCNSKHEKSIPEPSGRFVIANGHKLWIESSGNGKPLFLITGGPGSSHADMHSYDGLSDSSTLIFIDFFGRGKSDTAQLPIEYSIENDVSDLESVRKTLGYEKINVLGHSYGSLVAQLYAIKFPQHVEQLIIVSGLYSGKMWQETNDEYNHIFSNQMPEVWDAVLALREKGYRSSDKIHYELYEKFPLNFVHGYCTDNTFDLPDSCQVSFNHRVYYQIVGADGDFTLSGDAATYDVTKELINLPMPILIMTGRYDRMCNPKLTLEYKKFCPQAKFIMFENSGHNPQIDERDLLLREINAFLEN